MMLVLPYRAGSQSATALAHRLNCNRAVLRPNSVVTRPRGLSVINWGNSGDDIRINPNNHSLNLQENVRIAANKYDTLRVLHTDGVSVPEYTTDRTEASVWLSEGSKVVVRHLLRGNSGNGLELITEPSSPIPHAPLYTKYIPKQDEYRIHVCKASNGYVVFDAQRKARNTDIESDSINWQVRNTEGGFIFQRNNIHPPEDVLTQARAAVRALGLDFGAVDVIWNENRQKAYVLEVNTAPGLEGTTLDRYSSMLYRLINNQEVTELPFTPAVQSNTEGLEKEIEELREALEEAATREAALQEELTKKIEEGRVKSHTIECCQEKLRNIEKALEG